MISALIVDDEETGEQTLSKLIKRNHTDIELIPAAHDLSEAVSRIDEYKPQ